MAMGNNAPPRARLGSAQQGPRQIRKLARWTSQIVFGFLGLTIIGSVVQAFLAVGWNGLPTLAQIQQTYLVQLAIRYPWVFWPVSILVLAVAMYGLLIQVQHPESAGSRAETPPEYVAIQQNVATGAVVVQGPGPTHVYLGGGDGRAESGRPTLYPTAWKPPSDVAVLPLPPAAAGLLGRDSEQKWLEQCIVSMPASVTAVIGMGGIGKTALVAWVARQLASHFSGGLAVIRAAGVSSVDTITRNLIEKFVVDGSILLGRRVTTRSAMMTMLANALAELRLNSKRALVVIDNIEPPLVQDVGLKSLLDLLNASEVSVVVSARENLPARLVANSLSLQSLTMNAAADLFIRLSKRWGPHGPTVEERVQIAEICQFVGGHVLALVVAAAEWERHPLESLEAYRRRLETASTILDLAGPDAPKGVGRVFVSSYERLPDHAQRLFEALAILQSRSTSAAAVLSLAMSGLRMSSKEAADALTVLIQAQLVQLSSYTGAAGSFIELHPLVQQFAYRLLTRRRRSLVQRLYAALAAYYSHWALDIRNQLAQGEEDFMGGLRSTRILQPERDNLLACIKWTQSHLPREDATLAGLILGMSGYWYFSADSAIGLELVSQADRSFMRLGRSWSKGHVTYLYMMGDVARRSGDIEQAKDLYSRTLMISRKVRDRHREGRALRALGDVALRMGDAVSAQQYYEESLRIRREVQDRRGEAVTLRALGALAFAQGHLGEAEQYYVDSLKIRQEIHDRRGEAVALRGLGDVAVKHGNVPDAVDYYSRSLTIFEEEQDRQGEGEALAGLGDALLLRGDEQNAEARYKAALEIFREIAFRYDEGAVLSQLGLLQERQSKYDVAESSFRKSLQAATEVQSAELTARAKSALGLFLLRHSGPSKRLEGTRLALDAAELYQRLGRQDLADQITAEVMGLAGI